MWRGYVLAPILILLYFNKSIMIIQCWRGRCQCFAMKLPYKCGGKLVSERIRALKSSLVTRLYCTDDAVVTTSIRRVSLKPPWIKAECLTISICKLKLLVVGSGILEDDLAVHSITVSTLDNRIYRTKLSTSI